MCQNGGNMYKVAIIPMYQIAIKSKWPQSIEMVLKHVKILHTNGFQHVKKLEVWFEKTNHLATLARTTASLVSKLGKPYSSEVQVPTYIPIYLLLTTLDSATFSREVVRREKVFLLFGLVEGQWKTG
jgi:hypothetical protein